MTLASFCGRRRTTRDTKSSNSSSRYFPASPCGWVRARAWTSVPKCCTLFEECCNCLQRVTYFLTDCSNLKTTHRAPQFAFLARAKSCARRLPLRRRAPRRARPCAYRSRRSASSPCAPGVPPDAPFKYEDLAGRSCEEIPDISSSENTIL